MCLRYLMYRNLLQRTLIEGNIGYNKQIFKVPAYLILYIYQSFITNFVIIDKHFVRSLRIPYKWHHCIISVWILISVYEKVNLYFRSFTHLGAGLSVGISGLAAGYAIGIVGDSGVRGTAQQPRWNLLFFFIVYSLSHLHNYKIFVS